MIIHVFLAIIQTILISHKKNVYHAHTVKSMILSWESAQVVQLLHHYSMELNALNVLKTSTMIVQHYSAEVVQVTNHTIIKLSSVNVVNQLLSGMELLALDVIFLSISIWTHLNVKIVLQVNISMLQREYVRIHDLYLCDISHYITILLNQL